MATEKSGYSHVKQGTNQTQIKFCDISMELVLCIIMCRSGSGVKFESTFQGRPFREKREHKNTCVFLEID